MEPISIVSLALSVLTTSYKLYKDLSKDNILSYSAAIIDWQSGTIDQQWTLGNTGTGSPLYRKQMEISNILSLTGFIFPSEETDLFKLGILSKKNNTLSVHLREIGKLDPSQTVIIKFAKFFDRKQLYISLCEQYMQILPPFLNEELTQYIFSIMLDWAHVWKEDYKSVRFTNILLDYDNVAIEKELLEKAIPEPVKEKLLLNTRRALQKRADALMYLHIFNNSVQQLENEELKDRFSSLVHVESNNAEVHIHSLKCRVSQYKIGEGYIILFPDRFHIKLNCSVYASDQALKGKVIFFKKELSKSLSEIILHINERIRE